MSLLMSMSKRTAESRERDEKTSDMREIVLRRLKSREMLRREKSRSAETREREQERENF